MFDRSRRNLAYWFTLSMGSILVLFTSVGYWFAVREQIRTFDQNLLKRTQAILENPRFSTIQPTMPLPGTPEFSYVRLYDATRELDRSIGADAPRTLNQAPGWATISHDDPTAQGDAEADALLRQLTVPVRRGDQLIGYLQVAVPLAPLSASLRQAQLFLSISLPITLGIIGVVGWQLAGVALKPSRRAYEQLQRFTADASHELRTPVAGILSQAQVALMPPEEIGEMRSRLQQIVTAAQSMRSLIDQLLFLSRQDRPLNLESLHTIDLVALVRSIVDESMPNAINQSIQISVHSSKPVILIKADSDLIRQAIVNLISNALKYTPAGGSVDVQSFAQAARAVVEVRDTGIGIPEADLPHVFERFYRVDTMRTRETGGFGLGLAIARQIIEAHHGRITVTSKLSYGSTFRIEFPIAAPHPNQ